MKTFKIDEHQMESLMHQGEVRYRLSKLPAGFQTIPRSNTWGTNKIERAIAEKVAKAGGYYWLPCILCGAWSGGHESSTGSILYESGTGIGVCPSPECIKKAAEMNEKNDLMGKWLRPRDNPNRENEEK